MDLPTIRDIDAAYQRLKDVVVATPMLPFDQPDMTPGQVLLKCENLQRTGSFKIRGAYNRIASLSATERANGVIAYSSGNHAQGVACAARMLGVHATIVMPENAVPAKVDGTRRYGAEVVFEGTDSEARRRYAEHLAQERGAALVPPYDHPAVIAGQGTLGLEILAAVQDVQTVVVPIGGGGLISGIAIAIKQQQPTVRIVGVEPVGAADALASRRAGHLVELDRVDTIADGLRARRVGALPYAAIGAYVDDIVTVPDTAILDAVRLLLTHAHLVAEPSGAVTVAATLAGAARGRTVAVVSGGNVDVALLEQIIHGG